MQEECQQKSYRSNEERWLIKDGIAYLNPYYAEYFEERLKASAIPKVRLSVTFDNFEVNTDNKDIFQEFRDWTFDKKGICLGGKAGTGKSHLCTALSIELIKKDYDVYFVRLVTVLDKLMTLKSSSNHEDKYDYTKLMNRVKGCQILVLDDLGAEKMTDAKETALFEILDERVIYKLERKTFITTNLNWNEIFERFHERIGDRIQELCLLRKSSGESFRKILREREDPITKKTQS